MRQAPGETKFGTQTKKLTSITVFHSLITGWAITVVRPILKTRNVNDKCFTSIL